MSAGPLVVRPRLDAHRGHQLVDADGDVLASFEVAASRDSGAIVVDGRRWSVRRPPTGRDWTVRPEGDGFGGEVIATITKPSAIRERFELRLAAGCFTVEPRGSIGRRRWVVDGDGEPVLEVTQGVVRRRWHELCPPAGRSVAHDRLGAPGAAADPTLALVVAFVVALVDTSPPTGLSGLRRAKG